MREPDAEALAAVTRYFPHARLVDAGAVVHLGEQGKREYARGSADAWEIARLASVATLHVFRKTADKWTATVLIPGANGSLFTVRIRNATGARDCYLGAVEWFKTPTAAVAAIKSELESACADYERVMRTLKEARGPA